MDTDNSRSPATYSNGGGPRWVGTLLSMFFPCFGFVWAGQYKRALIWFVSLLVTGTLAVVLLAFDEVPSAVAAVFALICVFIQFSSYVKSYQRGSLKRWRWLALLIFASLFYLLPMPASMFVRAFVISTDSMSPTLIGKMRNPQGDYVIANKLSYLLAEPKRGDIIVFDTSKVPKLAHRQGQDEWTFYTFRVVGLPGETIEIKDGKIHAENKELTESDGVPAINYLSSQDLQMPPFISKSSVQLAEDQYFVLGDNSRNAFDSRFWGPVPRESILGKVTRIYYPFHRARSLSQKF